MSQAIALMPALNGYGTLTEDEDGSITEDTATETFITEGLAKVLKINNICDSEHLEDCGIPDKITAINASVIDSIPDTLVGLQSLFAGSFYSQTDTKAAAFETANGESIIAYYNPACSGDNEETNLYMQTKMCANFIYDLNGNKGPNTVGKDIGFISVLYPTDSIVVAPMPISRQQESNVSQVAAGNACRNLGGEEARLPNRFELASIFYNNKLVGATVSEQWSSTLYMKNGATQAWTMRFHSGNQGLRDKTGAGYYRCIKR